MTAVYSEFLTSKAVLAAPAGFTTSSALDLARPFQQELIQWACEQGRAAVFAECGLGKTPVQLMWAQECRTHTHLPTLILAPLAVAQQTAQEAAKFNVDAALIRSADDFSKARGVDVLLTNYDLLPSLLPHLPQIGAVALDESSVLKNYMGRTKQLLVDTFRDTRFKLALTATPSPNDVVELGNHAEFLGIMEPGEMLTRWFANDTSEAQNFRLKAHGEREFWAWVSSWARCLTRPSDLNPAYSDDGYVLPPLHYHVHTAHTDHAAAVEESGSLFRQAQGSATSLHAELRVTLTERATMVAAQVLAEPDEAWVIWATTNAEADAVQRLLPSAVEVRGNMTATVKEDRLAAFAQGEIRHLITKGSLAGFGMNWQHCGRHAFTSIDYSFEKFYQQLRRSWRFGRVGDVHAHLFVPDTHGGILAEVRRKQADHEAMQSKLVQATREAGTGQRHVLTIGPAHRRTETGEDFTLHNGDCIEVTRQLATASHDFQIFSPPFSNLYSYSPDLRDMGNTDDDGHFFAHFAYLIPELRRTLKPGRLCAVHVKNLPVYQSSSGYSGIRDFRGDTIRAFLDAEKCKDGSFWSYHSEVCIWTDPVREMQRTKSDGLLYKNIRTNAAKNRQGMAEYVVVFRKWTPGEMDSVERVTHDPADFTLEMWQRYASPVWMDILRTDVLNAKIASTDDDEKHLAPLQLEVIRRCVRLWTNPGDVVFTPFLGVGSEAVGAIQMGRRAEGVELKPAYFEWAVKNARAASQQAAGRLLPMVEAVG